MLKSYLVTLRMLVHLGLSSSSQLGSFQLVSLSKVSPVHHSPTKSIGICLSGAACASPALRASAVARTVIVTFISIVTSSLRASSLLRLLSFGLISVLHRGFSMPRAARVAIDDLL